MALKQKTRIHPSLDLDISFEFTKIIDCMTKEHTSMMVDKLERLKNEKFEKILIPEFEYEVEGNILTQRVEYIKGRQCGMTVKKYRDKIYKEFVERDSDWTFCDFKYDNFIVVNGIDKDKIYAIDFQSYNYLPSRKERLDLWEEYLETNDLVLEYITKELPFRKRKKMISTITNLNLKNEFIKNNTIDSTPGDWSFVPAENNLYLINNKDSKKYKIDITEVT